MFETLPHLWHTRDMKQTNKKGEASKMIKKITHATRIDRTEDEAIAEILEDYADCIAEGWEFDTGAELIEEEVGSHGQINVWEIIVQTTPAIFEPNGGLTAIDMERLGLE